MASPSQQNHIKPQDWQNFNKSTKIKLETKSYTIADIVFAPMDRVCYSLKKTKAA